MSGWRAPASASLYSFFTSQPPISRRLNREPMDFKDHRVWITGASSGIGEALAYAFHQAGAKLILSARREDELKRVQSQCGGEPSVRILPVDVARAAELPEKARLALEMFGGIDILVNNAGVTQRSLVKDTELEVYRRLMDVNFF